MKARSALRGKKLDFYCKTAKTTTHEFGPDDKRVFCHGLIDMRYEELVPECRVCGAHVDKAQSPERDGE